MDPRASRAGGPYMMERDTGAKDSRRPHDGDGRAARPGLIHPAQPRPVTAMTTDSLTCPYCNAYVPMPAGAAPGQRLPCPRCGEAFPYRSPEAGSDGPGPFSPNGNAPAFLAPMDAPAPPRRWSNRAV